MNFRLIVYILGQVIRAVGALMIIPIGCAVYYREDSLWALLVPMLLMLLVGSLCCLCRPAKGTGMAARDGLVAVGLSWIVLSLFGMLPFILCGALTNPVDAFFETVSGFTTTGATVLGAPLGIFPEDLDRGISLWRALTHWIGGMGVLVFVMAVMPRQDFKSTRLMHALRAEVPGPVATKVVPTLRHSARIMYGIYIVMTIAEIGMLLLGKMSLYDAVLHTFSTAGTGGFSNMNASVGAFDSSYIHWVITVFMLLFSINFNLYYLIITGHLLQALRSEELRYYLVIVAASVATITVNIASMYDSVSIALRDAAFQVISITSTTGFTTAYYDTWPALSQGILLLLMFIGSCAGSTGGGLKVGRLIIWVRAALRELRVLISPRQSRPVRSEGRPLEEDTVRATGAYVTLYTLILVASALVLLVLGLDLTSAFTGVITCLNNVGPAFGELFGASGLASFGSVHPLGKIVLALNMLLGRLELFPILMLFYPVSFRARHRRIRRSPDAM